MAKILIAGTKRYSINMCDFDLLFRKSKHEIVHVLHHKHTETFPWFHSGQFGDPARNKIATKLKDHPHSSWSTHAEFMGKVSKIDFDYICLGNGNDDAGVQIQKDLKGKKFLFSEYGWLPWSQCAYIDPKGVGRFSSIFSMGKEEFEKAEIDKSKPDDAILKNSFKGGNDFDYENYVYVPLQVDTLTSDGKKDFKLQGIRFQSNREFLDFVVSIVPKGVKVLAKDHPLARVATKMPKEVINITKADLDKTNLYNRMHAMVCVNSTSILESMIFGKPVFSYGPDIFSNKDITYEMIYDKDEFEKRMNQPFTPEKGYKFINMILERQIFRHKCGDQKYINNHYWNKKL